ncbi:class I SAM-dependent methyltransferase [Vibrio sinus]|uniref:class I SAM-dependent methyltransferase n=1 Tax=Vibrio sinus TaxID=2946865 RepID=UPI003D7C92EF
MSILEVGSGPGHLAEVIIRENRPSTYTLFDLSLAMNHIASKRLSKYDSRILYKTGSFLDSNCFSELRRYDAVVCMQSIHEVKDKQLARDVYRNIKKVIKPGGYFLVCDVVFGEPGMKDSSMFMTVNEQKEALESSGFSSLALVSEYEGLTLYSAQVK